MNTNYPIIRIKKGKENAVKRRHPWIFTGAIGSKDSINDGDLVKVVSDDGEFLAIGHYSDGPSIAVRIISFDEIEIEQEFWNNRLAEAYILRQAILKNLPETNVYRLVHGEGDGLPGLIIDIYNQTAVVQFHSIGVWKEREKIKSALINLLGKDLKTIYNKSESTMPNAYKSEIINEFWMGADTNGIVSEYGLKFLVDWEEGQKTGFFIDQRENRRLVQQYSDGRKVCNMFGYTGGFSVYAMAGNAKSVDTVDISKSAVEKSTQNVNLNFPNISSHRAIVADGFDFLDDCSNNSYDLIILDPPAFAKHYNTLENALKGYRRLNQMALEKISPDGILFTFSCSQAVSVQEFRKTIFVAAARAGRKVRILHQLSQPADHPINIFHPEGEYLKGLVLHVI
ncbi:MAG TPA: class I SAM-dependent rRNA methyltransferase [Salinivirgaceae bacterium]|nr:class I SAM-dependent rRNA methyltransferase [Salinivirgaceae bacterium]